MMKAVQPVSKKRQKLLYLKPSRRVQEGRHFEKKLKCKSQGLSEPPYQIWTKRTQRLNKTDVRTNKQPKVHGRIMMRFSLHKCEYAKTY